MRKPDFFKTLDSFQIKTFDKNFTKVLNGKNNIFKKSIFNSRKMKQGTHHLKSFRTKRHDSFTHVSLNDIKDKILKNHAPAPQMYTKVLRPGLCGVKKKMTRK